MRLMLIVVTVAVAMLLDLRVSQATQMPRCAGEPRRIETMPSKQLTTKHYVVASSWRALN
jgi:hypothetical protein